MLIFRWQILRALLRAPVELTFFGFRTWFFERKNDLQRGLIFDNSHTVCLRMPIRLPIRMTIRLPIRMPIRMTIRMIPNVGPAIRMLPLE